MSIYSAGLVLQMLLGLVTTVVVVHDLAPSDYGELGLYLLVPSTLLVVANIGLLQGTNQAIHAHAATGGRLEDRDAAGDAVQRILGTGLLMSLMSGLILAAITIALAAPLSFALGNAAHGRSLIVIGALSGMLAGGWRLTSNVLRYARRPVAWTLGHDSRAAASFAAIVVLLHFEHSVRAVILGFAVGTLVSLLVCLWLCRRYIRIAFDTAFAREILTGARAWVIIVIAYHIILTSGIYFVSLNASRNEVGLFSLATSLAVASHYLVSAFIYSAGSLRQSALRAGAAREIGELATDAGIFEAFVIASALCVLLLAAFARDLVLIAPHAYAGAAGLVPVAAATAIGRGYFAFTYSLVPNHSRKRFQVLGGVSLVLFVGLSFLLGRNFGAYGVASAGGISFLATGSIQLALGQRGETRLPLSARRTIAPIALAAAAIVGVLALPLHAGVVHALIGIGVVAVYLAVLAVTRIIPVGPLARLVIEVRGDRLPATWRLAHRTRELASTDVRLLRTLLRERRPPEKVADERRETESDVLLRFVALVRWLGQLDPHRPSDAALGRYLLFQGPYGIRDQMSMHLIAADVDPVELDKLEQIVQRLGHLPRWTLRGRSGGLAAAPLAVDYDATLPVRPGVEGGRAPLVDAFEGADT